MENELFESCLICGAQFAPEDAQEHFITAHLPQGDDSDDESAADWTEAIVHATDVADNETEGAADETEAAADKTEAVADETEPAADELESVANESESAADETEAVILL